MKGRLDDGSVGLPEVGVVVCVVVDRVNDVSGGVGVVVVGDVSLLGVGEVLLVADDTVASSDAVSVDPVLASLAG